MVLNYRGAQLSPQELATCNLRAVLKTCPGNEVHDEADKGEVNKSPTLLVKGGIVNAGVVNGGVANGGLANGGIVNGGIVNGGIANGGLANEGIVNGGIANGGIANGGIVNGNKENRIEIYRPRPDPDGMSCSYPDHPVFESSSNGLPDKESRMIAKNISADVDNTPPPTPMHGNSDDDSRPNQHEQSIVNIVEMKERHSSLSLDPQCRQSHDEDKDLNYGCGEPDN
ncbi:hypothetical protein HAZT_HAZT008148 [Hyalella azteca]|uniref:Uncharacterized protein n=1 Tax=Hyalella azteca TaxID=294128 RepID=A0A6A0GXG8_HYAAZ|nr:hypothetical protein HAZT_HAZT008148 [Hyalella azteca]